MNQNELGFYYCVFQPDPGRDRVRVWFDGEADYSYRTIEEMKKFALAAEESITPTYTKILKALRQYSFFLWRVKESEVRRLSFKESPESLREETMNSSKQYIKEKQTPQTRADDMWKTDIDLTSDNPVVRVWNPDQK